MSTAVANATCTPSEVVLLNGESFSPPLTGGYALLHSEATVELAPLATAIFSAAILACEQAGAIRLEPGTRKKWLGLRTEDALYVHAGGAPAEWPEHSWEARLVPLARARAERHAARGRHDVAWLLYDLMAEDWHSPEGHAISETIAGLKKRGLVGEEKTDGTFLKIIKTTRTRDVLTAEAVAAAARYPAASVQALFEACRRERPAVWELLRRDVARAFKWRIEADTSD